MLLVAYLSFGQSVKTYSGTFEDGKASYQYYEDAQFNRISHGSFLYIGKLWDMKGNYSNGTKAGVWEITANNKTAQGWGTIILNTKIKGNYVNGNFDGAWSYSNSIKYKDDLKKEADLVVSTANFNNGIFVGKFSYTETYPVKHTVTGQFDSLGFMCGTWNFNKGNLNDEIRFMNRVACWRLYNNLSTGEKKVFSDNTEFVKEFWKVFNQEEGISKINGKIYFPDTVLYSRDGIGKEKEGYPDVIGSDYHIWDGEPISIYKSVGLSNPLYYYKQGQNPPIGFQIVITECTANTSCGEKVFKQDNKKYKELMDSAHYYFESEKYELAITKYKKCLEYNRDNYVLGINIKIAQSRLEKQQVIKQRYDRHIFDADLAMKENHYGTAISEYNSAISIFNNEIYPKQQIEKAKLLKVEYDKIQLQKFLFERKNTIYDLTILNAQEYNLLVQKLQDKLIEDLHFNIQKEYSYEGAINITVDTLGTVKVELINSEGSKNKPLKEITAVVNAINYPIQKVKGYALNSKANIPLKVLMLKGSTKFLFKVRSTKSISALEFQKNECDPIVAQAILDEYYGKMYSNVYTDKYEYLKVNEKVYFFDELKEN